MVEWSNFGAVKVAGVERTLLKTHCGSHIGLRATGPFPTKEVHSPEVGAGRQHQHPTSQVTTIYAFKPKNATISETCV